MCQKNVPRAIKKSSKAMITILTTFLIDFGPTWIDFGRSLASKLEPSWDKMRIKSNPRANQKIDFFLDGFQIDFGWSLAPSWNPRGGGSPEMHFGSQEAPRSSQTTPRPILIRFCWVLLIFWLIFGRFLIDFCLDVGLLACWVAGFLVLCLACLLN